MSTGALLIICEFCLLFHVKLEVDVYKRQGFHMAVTEWNEATRAELADMEREGVTSFKAYMAYELSLIHISSSPYFFTFGRFRISSRQLSQVSPAVMRRSMEMAQASATAQRLGLV